MLPRHEPEPRRHVATVLELACIPDGGNHRGRRHRPDAPNASHPTARGALAEKLVDALFKLTDTRIDLVHEGEKASEDLAAELGQVVGFVSHDRRDHTTGPADRLGETDTTIKQDAAHLADQRGAMVHKPSACAVQRLGVLLLDRLLRHKSHVRLAKCRADRFRIIPVVLLASDERLHILGRNDPDLVSERFKLTLPEESASARLDSDLAG